MSNTKRIKTGDVFDTNEGCTTTVLEYRSSREVLVKFNDNHGYVTTTHAGNLHKGQIKNPYHPSVWGVGFIGVGEYTSIQKEDNKLTPAYVSWRNMLQRCYNPKRQAKSASYIDCVVHENWHNFQTYAKWYEQQYRTDGWHLDKDLIVEGNKVYSASTCVFIPLQLNILLTNNNASRGDLPQGVSRLRDKYRADLNVEGKQYYLGLFLSPEEAFIHYKLAKEYNIKRMAEKWRFLIDHRVYIALMRYEVKI